MTDRDALYAAIRANPDEDTPRLVYADWLQENNYAARADFIRAQIEAVRTDPFGPQARKAAKRAGELLERYQHQWTRHLHGGFAEWPRFERGFVAHLSIEPTKFVPQADKLFGAEPIQSLKLFRFNTTTERPSFEPLFELNQLRSLRRLGLSSHLFVDEEFSLLSSCPHIVGLHDLSLRLNRVPPRWLSTMLTKDLFPELEGLDLGDVTNMGPTLAEALPRAIHRNLRRLDASGVLFTSETLQRVLTSRCLRRVEELRLATGGIAGLEGPLFHLNLGWVIPWDHLVVLDLEGQRLGNEGVREISMRKEAVSLRWLGLANNHLSGDAIRYLVESKHLALNHLDVRGNGFSLSNLDALHKRFPEAVIED